MHDGRGDGEQLHAESGRPERQRRSQVDLILLALAIVLVVVAAIAASRGDSTELATSTTPTPDASGFDARPTPVDSATEAATPIPDIDPTEGLPMDGPGTFTYATGATTPIGAAPYRQYAVAVEDGIGVDVDEVDAIVDEVLRDERSWIGDGVTGFERVEPGQDALFTVVVAAPTTVDRLCLPLDTESRYSCGRNGWIALNLFRWETGPEVWPSTLDVYREYLINHEVGHYLLGSSHDNICPEAGGPAPIMMQQSILLDGCAPNGWVYPEE